MNIRRGSRLTLAALWAAVVLAAAPPEIPERVYVLAEINQDVEPFSWIEISELGPNASGSTIRWARVGKHPHCEKLIVMASEQASALTVPEVLEELDLCGMEQPNDPPQMREVMLHQLGFTVVAECGKQTRQLRFPSMSLQRIEAWRRANTVFRSLHDFGPRIAELADAPENIDDRQYVALQEAASAMRASLERADFDAGFGELEVPPCEGKGLSCAVQQFYEGMLPRDESACR